jgi:hypothetical protein
MKKFDQLTASQKKFVVAVIESNPQYKTDPVITLKECAAIYYEMKEKRAGKKGEKIGYPNWLFNANKLERGKYQLPVPTESQLSQFAQEMSVKANPVRAAKAKVISLSKTATESTFEMDAEESKLQKIIDDSLEFEDYDAASDFNDICREAGIDIGGDRNDYY